MAASRDREVTARFLVPGESGIPVIPFAAANFGKRQSGTDFGKTAHLADGLG